MPKNLINYTRLRKFAEVIYNLKTCSFISAEKFLVIRQRVNID